MAVGEYMTVQEAAKALQVSQEYVRRLARLGTLRRVMLHKQMSLIDAASVATYLATHDRKRGRKPRITPAP